MNVIWSFYREERRLKERRRRRRLLLSLLAVTALLGLSWKALVPADSTVPDAHISINHTAVPSDPEPHMRAINPQDSEKKRPAEVSAPDPEHLVVTREIASGDTLTAIFESQGIGQTVLYQVLSTDEPILALDVLRPGNKLTFTLDWETNRLICMELFIHPGSRVQYTLQDDGGFDYEEVTIPGTWKQELLAGDINGSFYLSALKSGLTDQETGNITELFRDHIRFSRDIRNGDHFQVIRSRQYVEGEFTGQSRVEGIHIQRGNRLHSAFLFDGNYYDREGNSLARAFRRYPMVGEYRVSSPFSRARRHPVTGRVSPHNGVDFAMPVGTPILSTGDGVITRVRNHPFAGKYIEIQHGSIYTTRYLHLSRFLVRQGQTVQRGERIALSGNTGRSTGPHLHFELHVRGQPVNPLTANIPMASSVPDERRSEFKRLVGELVAMMEHPAREVALHRD